MNCLPSEICGHIYGFDPTFKEIFSKTVIPYLCSKTMYRGRLKCSTDNNELFVFLDETYALVTNSLTNPTYRSTAFFHSIAERHEYRALFEWKEIIRTYPMTISFGNEDMLWEEFWQT